jgi:integrase
LPISLDFDEKTRGKAGIPLIRFNDLRHTYSSVLLSQDENIKHIKTQLGHSSPTVTLNVYSYLIVIQIKRLVASWKTALFRAPITIWSQIIKKRG